MRLILIDRDENRRKNFYPLTLSRPVWDLRCGMHSLGEKLVAKIGLSDGACFVPDYMAEVYSQNTDWPVNKLSSLTGDDLLILDGRLKADKLDIETKGPSEVGVDSEGAVLYARINQAETKKLKADSIESFLASAKDQLANKTCSLDTWKYTWDLVLANPGMLAADFASAGRSGIEGAVEQPNAIRGDKKDVYIAAGV